jgi:hypothetical protein
MDKRQKRRAKFRLYSGLLVGLLCNAVLIGKAIPYAFLPIGSVVYADSAYTNLYFILLIVSVFLGVPFAIWDAFRNKGQWGNGFITVIAVTACLTTFFMPYQLQRIIGDARQLRTPCYPCDGEETSIKGLYLIY